MVTSEAQSRTDLVITASSNAPTAEQALRDDPVGKWFPSAADVLTGEVIWEVELLDTEGTGSIVDYVLTVGYAVSVKVELQSRDFPGQWMQLTVVSH